MHLIAVGGEGQARRTGFVVELHLHRDLVGLGGHVEGGKAEGAPSESVAGMPSRNHSPALGPVGPHHRGPLARIEGPDRGPPRHRHGIRLREERLEVIRRDGESEILGDPVAQSHDSQNLTLEIHDRSAAVALLDRHGELQHRKLGGLPFPGEPGFQLADRGDRSGHDAEG